MCSSQLCKGAALGIHEQRLSLTLLSHQLLYTYTLYLFQGNRILKEYLQCNDKIIPLKIELHPHKPGIEDNFLSRGLQKSLQFELITFFLKLFLMQAEVAYAPQLQGLNIRAADRLCVILLFKCPFFDQTGCHFQKYSETRT